MSTTFQCSERIPAQSSSKRSPEVCRRFVFNASPHLFLEDAANENLNSSIERRYINTICGDSLGRVFVCTIICTV